MRFSLRLKLALLSLLLLAIPLSGLRLSNLVKENLLESRKQMLMFSAHAVSQALSGREDIFTEEGFVALDRKRDLYLYQLTNPMRLNGKVDDWHPHILKAQRFGQEHLLHASKNASTMEFRHISGSRGEYLYGIFLVEDDHVVLRQKNALALDRSDHLIIVLQDRLGEYRKYILSPHQFGWINAHLLQSGEDTILTTQPEERIQAVWEESQEGYIVELRMPLEMVSDRLAFGVADVDNATTGEVASLISTSNIEKDEEIGFLLKPSATIERILKSLNKPQSRIQIVDNNQRIRASFGTFNAAETLPESGETLPVNPMRQLVRPLLRLFTVPFTVDFSDPPPQPDSLNLDGVTEALGGTESISNYRKNNIEIMAAITPLYDGEKIVGAVVVEQTTSSILALHSQVLEESIGLTLLVLLFGGCGLLLFAFRISSRIRLLRDQALKAIDKNGQIRSIPHPQNDNDEIGDLSKTIHTMLLQLQQQNMFREKMADNLEHEMRTPLAGASASLKNLAKELSSQPAHVNNYVEWALGDIARMEKLLSSIRDATSLRQAIRHDFKDMLDLNEALNLWLEHGWKKTFPEVEFIFNHPGKPSFLLGDPDRLRQMLDKLIENGVTFHSKGTPITLDLVEESNHLIIHLTNIGPKIQEKRLGDIFNSMVSLRDTTDGEPHLGLGLFIVQTIAEYHNGTVVAENIHGEEGAVRFTVKLPKPSLGEKEQFSSSFR